MSNTQGDSPNLRLIAAPFTPFDEDGELELGVVSRQAEHLRRTGVEGAFVAGTTGESASLSVAERMRLAEEWREHAGGLRLIVHVGSANLQEAVELARHAESIGADAIGAVPPYYFRPATVDALVSTMAVIAAAAPSIPFLYYHIPAMTKVELPMVPFIAAARKAIPTFAGVKYTHADLIEFADCVREGGDEVEIMFGRDPLLLPALLLGGVTAVGSTFNFAAPAYFAMADAMRTGDFAAARAGQAMSSDLIALLNTHGGLAAQKAMMGVIGVDCGPARPPFGKLSERAIADLTRFAEERGLLSSTAIAL